VRLPENRSDYRCILGVRVDVTSYASATRQILDWARQKRSRYVCCAAVNNIMEARRSPDYQTVMDQADLVTSDGMPLVWMLRWLGAGSATRVYGPDLMCLLLRASEDAGIAVGFYGGSDAALGRIVTVAKQRYPRLHVAFAEAPPFRDLTPEEDHRTTKSIRDSGAQILFVGLGSPKQDRWMHAHKGCVPAVMLGVGAAFDFLAGVKPQAPRWMQSNGLEWVFRLATEPQRLWRRYLTQNPKFVLLAMAQLMGTRTP